MRSHAGGIGLAQALGPPDQNTAVVLEALEYVASFEGERLFGGVEDLENMAMHAALGISPHDVLDGFDRGQKIAEHHKPCMRRQSGDFREARSAPCTGLSFDGESDALDGVPAR